MNAKELRIGNWVDLNGAYRQVISIAAEDGEEYIKCLDSGLNFSKSIQPIPLTTEILEKCLTKVSDKEFKIEVPVYWSKTHHTEYWFYVKLYEYYATGESHVGWRPWVKKGNNADVIEIFLWGYLEYVHQLQNFYFSICQSELEIKL